MSGKLIRKKVEELSAALVAAEVSDPGSLADIRDRLDFVVRWAKKQGHADVARAAGESCALLQEMIAGRIAGAGAEASMNSIGNTVSALQKLVAGEEDRACGRAPQPR